MPIPDFSLVRLPDLMSLRGRAGVVTGGGRGIGLAIARRLAEAGADIVVADLDGPSAAGAADTISADFGVRTVATTVDVRDENSIDAVADLTQSEFGSVDIWVNNAAIYPFAHIEDTTVEMWDDVMAVNLRGTFLGIKSAGRRMKEKSKPGGVILNIASNAATFGREGLGHYAASKHGVAGITKTAAREFGPLGIRVLAIAPTIVATPGMQMRRASEKTQDSGDMEDRIAANLPLQRIGVPDDVARVCLFCASDMAAFMTGSMVVVDAGSAAG